MAHVGHWTSESVDALAHRVAFDFIAQIEKRMEAIPLSQTELAHRLGVSEGAVSKVLNNPQNLTMKTAAKYSRALGMKPALLAYEDGDPKNENGPVSSEVFTICWERAGKPRDLWSLETPLQRSTTKGVIYINRNSFWFGITMVNTCPLSYTARFGFAALAGVLVQATQTHSTEADAPVVSLIAEAGRTI